MSNKSNNIKSIMDTVEELKGFVEKAFESNHKSFDIHGAHSNQIITIRNNIEKINKVLHVGNGKEALMTRTSLLEDKQEQHSANISSIFKTIEDIHKQKEIESLVIKKTKNSNKELIAAVISVIAAIVAATIALLGKG